MYLPYKYILHKLYWLSRVNWANSGDKWDNRVAATMQCIHNGRLQRCRKRVDSGGGQSVILLTSQRFARMWHLVELKPGRCARDLRSLAWRKIGNDTAPGVQGKYLQGFNLQREQEASRVGQCVCSRAEEHAGANSGNYTDSAGLIMSQQLSWGTAHSKAKPSPILSPGSRDVLSQGEEEVHFPAKTFSFPWRYAPIASVTSPAFNWSPQFLLLTPSHHRILQREDEEGVNYSSYLSTAPQISEVWVGAVRRSVLAGSTGIKTRFIYHKYFTVR